MEIKYENNRKKNHLSKLINVIGTPDIKVITGVRRSGKSKLLELFKEHVEDSIPDHNVILIDFNNLKFDDLKEYKKLNEYIELKYQSNKTNFILIDEVQMCTNFELTINSLHASNKYDIYLTGSNAFLLSSDLATLFTGRTFSIEVFPFSFKEYIVYFGSTDIDTSFDNYFYEGGLSGSYLYKNIDDKYDYINKDVY